MQDRFDLQRFVAAQQGVYEQARAELRDGMKRSHWMWFVFPQIRGLGFSAMSRRYAIASVEEAAAYLEHPVLGPRLRECTALVLQVEGRSIDRIFASPDDMKFHSCMTLFDRADRAPERIFAAALQKFFGATPDPQTLERL
jgi:uncharacterized protein (DUF1810 family)